MTIKYAAYQISPDAYNRSVNQPNPRMYSPSFEKINVRFCLKTDIQTSFEICYMKQLTVQTCSLKRQIKAFTRQT